ncbi:MAG TPA: TrkH family potassium uptake protein [Fusibacter sp.]|nr:TrkH family potassium uptake protein [Fusibacter sp.]
MVVLGYFIIILVGGTLLSFPIASRSGEGVPLLNAFFTATSATCVTGLVVYDTYLQWSLFGQTVILILIQIGGLGFMTIITIFSVYLKRNIGLHERKLLMQSTGSMKIGGIVRMVKRIVTGTFIFEAIGTLLLATRFCPKLGFWDGLYTALFQSVSAFCNAGFDTLGRFGVFSSLTTYSNDYLVNFTIMMLIVTGGIGFIVWNDIILHRHQLKKYQLHSKIVLTATLVLIIVGTFLFYIFENQNSLADMHFSDKILASMFQSITPRTAGFNTVDIGSLSESAHLLTILLMFIGGSPGSTAGGIKTTTFVVMIMGALASSRHHSHINIFKRRLDEHIVREASAIATLYTFLILSSTLFISFIQEFELKDVLFEVVSAIGTVGLSTGITPALSEPSKMIIMLMMFAGRVGGLTLALVLAEKRTSTQANRPIEKIMIG